MERPAPSVITVEAARAAGSEKVIARRLGGVGRVDLEEWGGRAWVRVGRGQTKVELARKEGGTDPMP